MEDFTRESYLGEEGTALLERSCDVPLFCDLDIVIPGLGPSLHDRDCSNLDFKNKEWNSLLFQWLSQAGVINMVVGGDGISYLVEEDTFALEIDFHHAKCAGPSDIHKKAGSPGAHNPIIR